MRTYNSARFPADASDNRPEDIQSIITQQAVMCSVQRPQGNSLTGSRTLASVGSFECRIDLLSASPRTVETVDKYGRSSRVPYKILAMPTTDRLGNTVDIQHDDIVTVAGVIYRALYINSTSYLTEGVLEIS